MNTPHITDTEARQIIERHFSLDRIDMGDNVIPRCHWCGRAVTPKGYNLVHVGGEPNDVYACDDYLAGRYCKLPSKPEIMICSKAM